ncbi:uncharacterized protein EV422DRAFT_202748 [Fimicolochytrium jonesii]|uniref:uncharacterized protein n=1 Tax=Fimicolochytrium jonesii TaxID=1396493 RepID=UPI0022FED266|nr:uncharacterized protein EV422DRAFT_202748 [Fimicolochytrium jonesii]KAI8818014.1 hypothetical protein EV422DRAFT_202748 [Fimicolochytrium jonesii]
MLSPSSSKCRSGPWQKSLSAHLALLFGLASLLPTAPFPTSIFAKAAPSQLVYPQTSYEYVLLDPLPVNSTGETLVTNLLNVLGMKQTDSGQIIQFKTTSLGDNAITGLLLDYGDGCNSSLPVLSALPATAIHIALLNVTKSATCNITAAVVNSLTSMSTNGGVALIAFGDTGDDEIAALAQADYPPELVKPAYLFDKHLGSVMVALLQLVNGTQSGGQQPEFRLPDDPTAFIPGAPFPPNFPNPSPLPNFLPISGPVVRIGVRVVIKELVYNIFPPFWRFALLSLGIFLALSVPAVALMRWRTSRYITAQSQQRAAAAPVTLDVATLNARSHIAPFATIRSTYEGSAQCSICLDEFDADTPVRQLQPCGHAFHPPCVDQWLTEQTAVCPLCRTSLLEDKPANQADGDTAAADVAGGRRTAIALTRLWHPRRAAAAGTRVTPASEPGRRQSSSATLANAPPERPHQRQTRRWWPFSRASPSTTDGTAADLERGTDVIQLEEQRRPPVS